MLNSECIVYIVYIKIEYTLGQLPQNPNFYFMFTFIFDDRFDCLCMCYASLAQFCRDLSFFTDVSSQLLFTGGFLLHYTSEALYYI